MAAPLPFDARLVGARALSPAVRELSFERVDGGALDFEAGQWVNVFLPLSPGEPPLKRSYSVASAPDRSARFEIAVTRVLGGAGSNYLHDVAPGTTLSFSGPQGFFTRPLGVAAPSLFIATGTGVTPFRSMIRAALAAGSREPIWLLFGVRREGDILYADELREASLAPQRRFEPTLSQPGDGWTGRRGYVQAHLAELWAELKGQSQVPPHAYICGLHKMVGSVRLMLRNELGASREQLHSERYD